MVQMAHFLSQICLNKPRLTLKRTIGEAGDLRMPICRGESMGVVRLQPHRVWIVTVVLRAKFLPVSDNLSRLIDDDRSTFTWAYLTTFVQTMSNFRGCT